MATTNAKQVQAQFRAIMKTYRREMQLGISDAIDNIRSIAAKKMIISNKSNALNPSIARRRQKSTPGRLTSRTGKLKWALLEKKKWSDVGKILRKMKTSTMDMKIRATERQATSEEYEGTIRVDIGSHGRLWSRGIFDKTDKSQWMPIESPETIFWRFMWEHRGRPFLAPAARVYSFDFSNQVQKRLDDIARI